MGAREAVGHPAKIGQVANETGLSIDTIRFYEKQGLLKRSPRTEGGFRLFDAGDIETLKFVRKAQELGFFPLLEGPPESIICWHAGIRSSGTLLNSSCSASIYECEPEHSLALAEPLAGPPE
jgi:hypothetical protein